MPGPLARDGTEAHGTPPAPVSPAAPAGRPYACPALCPTPKLRLSPGTKMALGSCLSPVLKPGLPEHKRAQIASSVWSTISVREMASRFCLPQLGDQHRGPCTFRLPQPRMGTVASATARAAGGRGDGEGGPGG